MDLINWIFNHVLNQYVIVYLDGIMVYLKDSQDHVFHLTHVLEILCQHDLYAMISKSSL